MNRTTISAVLFDLDGTLVETHIDFRAMTRAMRSMSADAGVPRDVIDGHDILGIVSASRRWIGDRDDDGDGDAFQAEAFALLEDLEVDGCRAPIEIPGAAHTLEELRRLYIPIGIVTRNCRRVAKQLVSTFGLTYDVLLTRDDVPNVKPDPDHLHRALDILEVDPRRSMMVGDHWMDVRAGVDAGCAVTVGVLYGRTPEFYIPCPPTHLAASIADILDWL